jgi:hypothetical protein
MKGTPIMNMKKKVLNGVIMATLLMSLVSRAYAVPTVDGIYSASDGYTTSYNTTYTVQGGATTYSGGQLWTYQDPTTHDVYVAFLQPKTLVDNTYGTNAIGWGSKGHKFSDLTGSDMADFQFKNGNGAIVLDVNLDYISTKSGASSGYGSLGVTGGDGKVNTGSASSVLAYGTSIDYNLNNLGCSSFTTNSPATDSNYTPNASCSGWVFDDEYEIKVSGSLFGSTGAYSLSLPLVHDSPNKVGKNEIYFNPGPPITPPTGCEANPTAPECQPPVTVPEPSSLLILGSGLAGLAFWGRKRLLV